MNQWGATEKLLFAARRQMMKLVRSYVMIPTMTKYHLMISSVHMERDKMTNDTTLIPIFMPMPTDALDTLALAVVCAAFLIAIIIICKRFW